MRNTQIPMGVERQSPNEHLVAIHPDVLSDAEHVLGNLFHRIYHATRLNRESLGPHVERLTAAVEDLESVVGLVFDYVTPLELELRPIPVVRVAESLISQITARTKGEVVLGECPPVSVLADSRRLRRCFELLGRACDRDWAASSQISVRVRYDSSAEQAEILVSCTGASEGNGARSDSLLWAVADRLIELHGGALRQAPSATASSCMIVLPATKDGDVGI